MAKRDNATEAEKTAETPHSPLSAPPPAGSGAPPAAFKAEKAEKLVYLGPTLVEDRRMFGHGQIFNRGLPEAWRKKAESDADFRQLLIPFARVPGARTALGDADSALSAAAKRVKAANSVRQTKKKEAK